MIDDVIDYCKENPNKVSDVFPITVDSSSYDKNATYCSKTTTFFTLDELVNAKNNAREL